MKKSEIVNSLKNSSQLSILELNVGLYHIFASDYYDAVINCLQNQKLLTKL